MLASRCVMFHEISLDSARRTLKGEEDKSHRSTRGNLVALDRAFGANLTRLLRYRDLNPEIQAEQPASHAAFHQEAAPVPHDDPATAMRPEDMRPEDMSPGDADPVRASAMETVPSPLASAETATPAHPTEAAATRATGLSTAASTMQYRNDTASDQPPPWALPAPGPGVRAPEIADFPVSSERIAACLANPAAMAALKANDPAAFARALGVEPSEEFLAAAAALDSPFTQKWRADLAQLADAKRKIHSPEFEPA
jgi:hypothetical protein